MSPLLFAIVVDFVKKKCKRRLNIEILYADDVVLTSETMEGLKERFLKWKNATISTSNKDANLICYVRFIDKNGDILEGLLFCKPILLSCKAHDLFAILNKFFEENNVD